MNWLYAFTTSWSWNLSLTNSFAYLFISSSFHPRSHPAQTTATDLYKGVFWFISIQRRKWRNITQTTFINVMELIIIIILVYYLLLNVFSVWWLLNLYNIQGRGWVGDGVTIVKRKITKRSITFICIGYISIALSIHQAKSFGFRMLSMYININMYLCFAAATEGEIS